MFTFFVLFLGMDDYLKYLGAGALTIGAISTALLLKSGPPAIEPLVDLNKQSIVISVSIHPLQLKSKFFPFYLDKV